jgi:hypothetical protein
MMIEAPRLLTLMEYLRFIFKPPIIGASYTGVSECLRN